MHIPSFLLSAFLTILTAYAAPSVIAAAAPSVLANAPSGLLTNAVSKTPASNPKRLFCKTGSENRAANQPLKLYFQYHLPMLFEAEDPTLPFGRQELVASGRPLMQLFFEKSYVPAGENGERLAPMTCAFAKRVVSASEPSQVQIFLPNGQGQVHWLTQSVGQRPGPKQLSFERAVMAPAGDWAFASQFERVFSIELDDMKTFVTTQLPR
jgi:hypothetical protein